MYEHGGKTPRHLGGSDGRMSPRNLASMAGSTLDRESVRSMGTLDTENTYLQQYKPSFSTYTQYLFSVLAAVISAKEIWRFPYTIMGHESGLFILIYVFFTLTIGIPIVYLELIIGTVFKYGAVQCFKTMSNRAMGIGVSQLFVSFVFLTYQPLIMAWSLYYIYLSFQSPLPWITCPTKGDSISVCCINDSTTSFWFERTLNVSTGIADPQPTHTQHILICFIISWIAAYLCLIRGIRLGAFISYFTVTIPLVILPIIFIRLIFLDGAIAGLQAFWVPHPMASMKVSFPLMLMDTIAQILNTCGVAVGILMTFKSRSEKAGYPTFEAFVVGLSNMFMSIMSGAILFAIIGHRMKFKGRPADEMFISRGASVIFSVFPYAFEHFKYPNFWSVLFFSALVLITMDSMYGQVNAITLSLMDLDTFVNIPYSSLSLIITLASFLAGLPYVMGNGVYLFEEMDSSLCPVILVAVLIEATYVSWVYDIDKISKELSEKTEFKMNDVWKFLLKWFIPITLSLVFITWSVTALLIEKPSYMKYVGCEKGGWKGLKGSRKWFRKTYLTPQETSIEWFIFVSCFSPIPLYIWYYWPTAPQPQYQQFD